MSIQASELRPNDGATHSKKRLGRGNSSGQGTYAGRGLKGQKSRSGKKLPYDAFEGGQLPYARKFPALRGFNNKWRVPFQPVNLGALERFEDGATITPEVLRQAGIIKHMRDPIAILGDGELTRKLNISAHRFSGQATTRITALGGTLTTLEVERKGKIR